MDEIELLGFPLCSPFELVSEEMPSLCADELESYRGRRVRIAGYFVTTKPVRTVNRKRMSFGCWLDREGNFFDTVHFPDVHRRYPIHGLGCYLIEGKVVEDFGLYSIEVSRVRPLARVRGRKDEAEVKAQV
jgi:DNA polymerase-3 subunit alpha